jgi:hypothetical protein
MQAAKNAVEKVLELNRQAEHATRNAGEMITLAKTMATNG